MKTATFTFHAALGFSEVDFTMDVKVAPYIDADRLKTLGEHLAKKLGVYLKSTQVEGGQSA